MSRSMRLVRGRGRYAICALLALAALGLLLAERTAGAASRSATLWSAPRSGNAFSFYDQAKRFAAPIFGPNVRANQDTTIYAQHEPSLAMSRVHTNTVIVASKDYRQANVKRVWIDGSTDGGATWPVQIHMPNLPATDSESDPVVMARDDGRIYVACLTTGNNGIWITWTDDDGQTWHPSVPIIQNQGGLQDKEWFAIDNNPASPYYHRMYMMYVPDPGFGSGVVEHHSTDGGLTWSGQQPIGGADTEYTYPVIATDGTVYNFMMENWGFGQTGTVQMTKSTNGGATWSAPADVATAFQPVSPIRQPDQFRFFAIISAAIDPINGNLYVAWTDNRNFNTNGTDVVYVRSTNGGAGWSAVTRLSHDPTGVVRDHITPMLKVGADGKLHAFWLDRRLDPNNRLFDSWYSSSTDGGNTWEPDTRVSTISQDLNVGLPCCSGNYPAGDYWGLDTALDTVYVAWNDTRSGDQDILVAKGLMNFSGPPTTTPTVTGTPPTATTISTATGTSVPTNTPTASATPVCTISASSDNVPKTIPVGGTITSTLTVNQGASIADIDLVLGLNSDSTSGGFRVSLTSPAGTTRVLVDAACGPYHNIYLDDEAAQSIMGQCPPLTRQRFRPYTPLTAFDGENSAGAWTLTATDLTSESEGELFAWGLLITGNGLCPTGTPGVGTPTSPASTATLTVQGTATATRTATAMASATPQPECDVSVQFADVPPTHTFYAYVQCLTCRGIISGYPCGGTGEPCFVENMPYFRPNNSITRGQIAKIVSSSAGFNEEAGMQIFEDVHEGSPFYAWINRLAMRGHMAGYPCGTLTSEPCVSPGNRPYFRPMANATRGQLAKIVANAAQFQDNPGPQIYEDVPTNNTFFAFINRLSNRQVMGGYLCGTMPGEPCMPPGNRPYFRWAADVTRGQASKIVANTFFQGCETRIRP
jgi:subtilisin-like proprotein convertase family protein